VRIGIDGSNLRSGGALTHIRELLHAADPNRQGFRRITIWGNRSLLSQLPDSPWLERVHQELLETGLARRVFWQRRTLPRLAGRHCKSAPNNTSAANIQNCQPVDFPGTGNASA